MSVSVVMRWEPAEGLDEALYWQITDELGTRDSLPDGCEYHIVAFDPENGATVSEVWTSPESFKTFVESQLAPAAQKVGLPQPTSTTVSPLIRHFAG